MSDTRQVQGATALVRKLQTIRAASAGILADSQISTLLIQRVRARFAQGVSPDGTPWPGLMETTIKTKERKGYKNPRAPLQATGRLFKSLQIIQGSNAGLLSGNTGAGFRIGIADPMAAAYGRFHNYGIAGQEKRQFIGISRLDVVAVSGLLRRKMKAVMEA